MNLGLALVAIAVTSGAVVCVAARATRLAVGGLLVALAGSAILAAPLPEPAALAARLLAAVLAVYLPYVTVRDRPTVSRGSLLGWPVEAVVAAAAAIVGYGTVGLGSTALGPAEAQAAGFALIALSVGPIVFGRDLFRLGAGSMLLVVGVGLVRVALGGTPGGLEEIVTGGMTIGLGAALAYLLSHAATAGLVDADVLDDRRPVTDSARPVVEPAPATGRRSRPPASTARSAR